MKEDIKNKFIEILGEDNVQENEPMSRHTTFRIGGPADLFLDPQDEHAVKQIYEIIKEEKLPYFLIGNGSNVLVGDKGYRGVIVHLGKNIKNIEVNENRITAGAGAILSSVAGTAREEGLTGFEFAAGIPGTVGGAVYMNAGAYGGEMKDIIEKAVIIDENGEIREVTCEDLQLSYRRSIIYEKNWTVLSVTFLLKQGDREEIRARMQELSQKRIEKQPLEYPSAGSTFKRPEGHFAGKLIMDAGLRGYTVGGAQVSEKHCGFVINIGGATAEDVRKLMQDVQNKVYEEFQVELEPEVRFLGEFQEG